jgi:hypothetical protein
MEVTGQSSVQKAYLAVGFLFVVRPFVSKMMQIVTAVVARQLANFGGRVGVLRHRWGRAPLLVFAPIYSIRRRQAHSRAGRRRGGQKERVIKNTAARPRKIDCCASARE